MKFSHHCNLRLVSNLCNHFLAVLRSDKCSVIKRNWLRLWFMITVTELSCQIPSVSLILEINSGRWVSEITSTLIHNLLSVFPNCISLLLSNWSFEYFPRHKCDIILTLTCEVFQINFLRKNLRLRFKFLFIFLNLTSSFAPIFVNVHVLMLWCIYFRSQVVLLVQHFHIVCHF